MSKSSKAICAVLLSFFSLVILLVITVIIIEKNTDCLFFINETFCEPSLFPLFWLGISGDACAILIICIKKKAKRICSVLSVAVILFSLLAGVISLVLPSMVERNIYYERSPDGKNEIIIISEQFLIADSGCVFYRVNPFFIRRLENEENKFVEWFYDDYTIEWYDGYVIVDGYTYLLSEK